MNVWENAAAAMYDNGIPMYVRVNGHRKPYVRIGHMELIG